MNSKNIIISIFAVILIGFLVYTLYPQANNSDTQISNSSIELAMEDDEEVSDFDDVTDTNGTLENLDESQSTEGSAMDSEEGEESLDGDGQDETNEKPGEYKNYSESDVEQALQSDGYAVLFFHAGWCPTCRAANQDIISYPQLLPKNITVFKVDYDTATELKTQYGITYQHTFVLIDSNKNEVAQWSGGGAETIEKNVRKYR